MQRALFDDTHEAFRSAFRSFLEREAVPHFARWEADGIVDRSLFAVAGANGFLGMEVPEELGGGGVDDFRFNVVIAEELQRADVNSLGLGLTLHNDICLPYFLHLTNEEQKARWLPGICAGELITAVAMTEPGDRVGPGVDDDDRDPRRGPLRGERLQDLHHERDQRRRGGDGREDRSGAASPGDVVAGAGARHGGVRAGPQPGQDRDARPGHGGALLRRRAGAGDEPARRRGHRVRCS